MLISNMLFKDQNLIYQSRHNVFYYFAISFCIVISIFFNYIFFLILLPDLQSNEIPIPSFFVVYFSLTIFQGMFVLQLYLLYGRKIVITEERIIFIEKDIKMNMYIIPWSALKIDGVNVKHIYIHKFVAIIKVRIMTRNNDIFNFYFAELSKEAISSLKIAKNAGFVNNENIQVKRRLNVEFIVLIFIIGNISLVIFILILIVIRNIKRRCLTIASSL